MLGNLKQSQNKKKHILCFPSVFSESGEKKRPVIIHRAILGSVERMIAILTESYAGKWPFWLSPRQAMVIPVGPNFDEYAVNVKDKLHAAGFMSEVDTDHGDTLNKKVRNAQLAQFNFILGRSYLVFSLICNVQLTFSLFAVVGEKERSSGTVNVRTRDNVVHGEFTLEDLIKKFSSLKENYSNNEEKF